MSRRNLVISAGKRSGRQASLIKGAPAVSPVSPVDASLRDQQSDPVDHHAVALLIMKHAPPHPARPRAPTRRPAASRHPPPASRPAVSRQPSAVSRPGWPSWPSWPRRPGQSRPPTGHRNAIAPDPTEAGSGARDWLRRLSERSDELRLALPGTPTGVLLVDHEQPPVATNHDRTVLGGQRSQ